MLLVAEQSSRITWIPQVVPEVTLHVHGMSAQVSAPHQLSHAPSHVTELLVVSNCYLEGFLFGQVQQLLRFLGVQGEGFLNIYMAAMLEAGSRNVEVSARRRGYVNNVRPGVAQKFIHIREVGFDRKAFEELPGHKRFTVAHSHDLAAAY